MLSSLPRPAPVCGRQAMRIQLISILILAMLETLHPPVSASMLRPTARSPLQLALLMTGFAVIAVTSISSLWLTDRINDVSDEVAHSLQVNAALVTYIAALRRAESGQRGYLVTGRSEVNTSELKPLMRHADSVFCV